MESFRQEQLKARKRGAKWKIRGKSKKIREKIKYCAFLSLGLTFLPTLRPFANVPAQAIGSRFPSCQNNNTVGLAVSCGITGKCYASESSAQSTTAPSSHSSLRCRRLIESDGTHDNGTVDVAVFSGRRGRNTCRIRPSCLGEGLG